MYKPKVSVVIPCFNAETYLRQCLDSIVGQTLGEIEIICVNDGSTDSTLSILREYAANDSRIRVIDKPNGGYGESMNCGFDMASGEYLGLVESDDFADPDMFEKLYRTASAFDLDVAKAGFYRYTSGPEEKNIPRPVASRITSGRTFCPVADFPAKVEMVEFFITQPSIWSAIYRRSFIRENNIRFNETPGASFQDTAFNFKVWALARRVRLIEDCLLHYRQDNEGSSVNSPGKAYCVCDEYDEMLRFLDLHQDLKGQLLPILVRMEYESYTWNYYRLSEPLQAAFIRRFRDDLLRHRIGGAVRTGYFDSASRNLLDQILYDPDRFHKYQTMRTAGLPVPEFYATDEEIRRKAYLESLPGWKRHAVSLYWFWQKNGTGKTLRRVARWIRKKAGA